MKKLDIEEIKKLSYNILKEFKRICEKYDLHYWLSYGTLLGAVRHKGFIPWDDDIDVCMPRADYMKFIEVFSKETDSRYEIISPYEAKKSFYRRMKIADNNTFMYEYGKKRPAVFIDVFPVDGFDSIRVFHKNRRRVQLLMTLYVLIDSGEMMAKNKLRYTLETLVLYLANVIGRKRITNIINDYLLKKYDFYKCPYFAYVESSYGLDAIYPHEYVDELCEWLFEDEMFKIPCGYDKYLTRLYGKYMELPPIESRVQAHGGYEMWLNE